MLRWVRGCSQDYEGGDQPRDDRHRPVDRHVRGAVDGWVVHDRIPTLARRDEPDTTPEAARRRSRLRTYQEDDE